MALRTPLSLGIAAAGLAGVLSSGCAPPPEGEEPRVLEATLMGPYGPLEGWTVRVYEAEELLVDGTADRMGRFRLEVPPEHPAVELWVHTPAGVGDEVVAVRRDLRPPAEVRVEVSNIPEASTGRVLGRIVDRAGRVPPGAHVTFSRNWGRSSDPVPADPVSGAFAIGPIDIGGIVVTARAEGYLGTKTSTLRVTPGLTTDAGTLVLEPAGAVELTFLRPDGHPANGLWVRRTDVRGRTVDERLPQNHIAWEAVAAGSLEVEYWGETAAYGRVELAVAQGETAARSVRTQAATTRRIQVVHAQQRGVRWPPRVRALTPGGLGRDLSFNDLERLRGLVLGRHELVLTDERGQRGWASFEVNHLDRDPTPKVVRVRWE